MPELESNTKPVKINGLESFLWSLVPGMKSVEAWKEGNYASAVAWGAFDAVTMIPAFRVAMIAGKAAMAARAANVIADTAANMSLKSTIKSAIKAQEPAVDKVAALAAKRLSDFAAQASKIPGATITISDHTASSALSTAAAELGAPQLAGGSGAGLWASLTGAAGRRAFFLKRDIAALFSSTAAPIESAAAGIKLQSLGTAVNQWGQPASAWTLNELRNLGETIPHKVAAELETQRAAAESANSTLQDLRGPAKTHVPDSLHDNRNSLRADTPKGDDKAAAMREWDAYVDCKVSQKHGFAGTCARPNSPNPY